MNSKMSKNVVSNLKKMTVDSLKFHQNEDGSFTAQWDPKDPNWSFLNRLTTEEIQSIIEQAIKDDTHEH